MHKRKPGGEGCKRKFVSLAFFNIKIMKNLLTVIAFFPQQEKKFIKYRNVKNLSGLQKYLQTRGAKHCNVYSPEREFIKQIVFY